MNTPDDDFAVSCPECDDTGLCPHCAGEDPEMTNCEECNGSGKCVDCDES